MNRRLQGIKYLIFDYIAAIISWSLFFIFRKTTIENSVCCQWGAIFSDLNLYKGLLLVPLFWLCLYFCQGTYLDPYRKSRLKELEQTFFISLFGMVIIFFALLLNDSIRTYQTYYFSFFVLFFTHFFITYIPRLIITTITTKRLHDRKIGFATIIVGNNSQAEKIYHDIENQEIFPGNKIIGYVNLEECGNGLGKYLPCLGEYKDINSIIATRSEERRVGKE